MQLSILVNSVDNTFLNLKILECVQSFKGMIPTNIFAIDTSNPFFFQAAPIQHFAPNEGLVIATSPETARALSGDKAFQFVWNNPKEAIYKNLIVRNEVMQEEIGGIIAGDFDPTFIKNLWRQFIPDRYSSMNW